MLQGGSGVLQGRARVSWRFQGSLKGLWKIQEGSEVVHRPDIDCERSFSKEQMSLRELDRALGRSLRGPGSSRVHGNDVRAFSGHAGELESSVRASGVVNRIQAEVRGLQVSLSSFQVGLGLFWDSGPLRPGSACSGADWFVLVWSGLFSGGVLSVGCFD